MDRALSMEVAAMSRQRKINEMIENGDSDIQRFYNDTVIFITGGSGFLGKQLIEKFFRSCKIKRIYLLMRPKKTNTIEQRLAEMLTDPVYDGLKEKQPNFEQKIILVDGDVGKVRLGLSDEMWNTLTEEVDIIVHGAATISFVENIKNATSINVKGTIEMLNFGKACKRLKSYVHISTAYSHATNYRIQNEVLEKFYDSPLAPTTLIDLVEKLDDEKLKLIVPHLIRGWPNTYTFTKAVAEEAVRTIGGSLPICIVRPAIVICSHREPLPGWIDQSNVFGASGVVVGLGLGVIHTLYADMASYLDIVPVDVVNNSIIAAGWRTAVARSDTPTIYTVTGMRNPVKLEYIEHLMTNDSRQIATDYALWYCCAVMTKSKYLFQLMFWVFHLIPAYLIDIILKIMGHKISAVRLYNKAYRLNSLLSFFLINYWDFKDTNLLELYRSLSSADQVIYNCDAALIDKKEQIFTWMLGIRKYIVKDGLKNTEWGVKKQFYLKIVHYIFAPLYFYLLWKVAFLMFSIVLFIYLTCHNFIEYLWITLHVRMNNLTV